ncbi:MAG: M50 family metallopeptidase [Fimbriimonadaceae bacterium]|jgi:hypothetical protein|nr:M50 family metallopeptidase [Fimbriimonadaceae bacterium]
MNQDPAQPYQLPPETELFPFLPLKWVVRIQALMVFGLFLSLTVFWTQNRVSAPLLLITIVCALASAVVVHEGGHAVFARIGRLPISRISLFGLAYDFRTNRFEFLTQKGALAFVQVDPREVETPALRLFLWGGILGNLIVAAVFIALAAFSSSPIAFFLWAISLINLFFALISILPFYANPSLPSDGLWLSFLKVSDRKVLEIFRSSAQLSEISSQSLVLYRRDLLSQETSLSIRSLHLLRLAANALHRRDWGEAEEIYKDYLETLNDDIPDPYAYYGLIQCLVFFTRYADNPALASVLQQRLKVYVSKPESDPTYAIVKAWKEENVPKAHELAKRVKKRIQGSLPSKEAKADFCSLIDQLIDPAIVAQSTWQKG